MVNVTATMISAIADQAIDSEEAYSRDYFSDRLKAANEAYSEALEKIKDYSLSNELDEAVGLRLLETENHACALGVKWGMLAMLQLMMEGGEKCDVSTRSSVEIPPHD